MMKGPKWSHIRAWCTTQWPANVYDADLNMATLSSRGGRGEAGWGPSDREGLSPSYPGARCLHLSSHFGQEPAPSGDRPSSQHWGSHPATARHEAGRPDGLPFFVSARQGDKKDP